MVTEEGQPALLRVRCAHRPVLARKVSGRVAVLFGSIYSELAMAAGCKPDAGYTSRRRHWAHNSERHPKDGLAESRIGPHAVDGRDVAVAAAVHVGKAGAYVVRNDRSR